MLPLVAVVCVQLFSKKLKKSAIPVFTLLVCNRAGNLAGRLAGRLAFAAAALDATLFQVGLIQRLDLFHDKIPTFPVNFSIYFIITQARSKRKSSYRIFCRFRMERTPPSAPASTMTASRVIAETVATSCA